MLKKLTIFLMLAMTMLPAAAQVTYSPDPLTEDSENVVIYFHADQGSKGLANLPESTAVYAHTGVITTSSSSDSDWKYAPDWSKNEDKYKMTYVSPNLYELKIGNIRKFYGITNNSERVTKLAFVFRNAAGNKTGKATGDKDIFVNVEVTGMLVSLTSDLEGTTVSDLNPTVNFTFTTTQPADELWISINGNRVAETTNATELKTAYTFTEVGSYNIYGNAKLDGKIYSTNLKYTYVNASEEKEYPGGVPKMGSTANADGSVTFCIAAPLKMAAKLIGSWNDYLADESSLMYFQDYDGQRYFWKTIPDIDPERQYLYYFEIDGNYKVGDPYAKLVLDPQNDKYISSTVYPNLPAYPTDKVRNVWLAVYQGNINDYEWTDDDFVAPDKTNLVIYELLFRDFTGTEGKANGNGTVKLALEKLPYLKELGVNVIELLPINEFNGNISWGYNPNFYFAPDKAYGTPDDYKEFINACHENGIAVVLDLVFNQTDWQHPWYQMYPVGSNPFYNADAPHAYSVLNDINQGHPLIRQQWKDVVKYWMEEYHVDGYRFDLVKGLGDNDSYANNGDAATNAYNASRIANMHAIQEAMNEINPDAYFINENLAGAQEENAMAAFGMLNWANVNNAGCQYAMGYSSDSNLNRMYAVNDGRSWGSTVAYLESHDEERLAYKQITYGQALVKNDHRVACQRLGSAAAQMILVPGSHMIWQFSEMGNAQTTKNADGGNNVDPKIVNWDLLNDPDNKGLYDTYCRLINIRLGNPDLFAKEGTSFAMTCTANTWSKGRTILASSEDKELIAVINPNLDKEVTVEVPFRSKNPNDYAIAVSSYASLPKYSVEAGTVTVPANCFVVICSMNVTDVENIEASLGEGSLHAMGVNGQLIVTNAANGIEIYDINGMPLYRSAAESANVELSAGIYIVRSGAETAKVVVSK